jgi:hypothetical protein
MNDQPVQKCTVLDGKFVLACMALSSVCEPANPRGKQKGVFAWELSTPNGPTRTMFGAKSGDHVVKGMLFNFCPFCGERIDAPFVQGDEATDQP